MQEVIVTKIRKDDVEEKSIKFAVISAKYDGKWVFVRHKKRTTLEITGGHREDGETVLECAHRELYEETGASDYTLSEVCTYKVTIDGEPSYGRLFFADIKAFDNVPEEFEIAERIYLDTLPKNLTYPQIQPYLHSYVQGWLNLKCNSDELWDIRNSKGELVGRTHRRGDELQKGDYHLVVHVAVANSKGEVLITKRAPNKGYPNMWEFSGGSALAGDDSITAAIREIKEETGFDLHKENGTLLETRLGDDQINDIWLFREDLDIRKFVMQEGETTDAKFATRENVKKLLESGDFVPLKYIDLVFDSI